MIQLFVKDFDRGTNIAELGIRVSGSLAHRLYVREAYGKFNIYKKDLNIGFESKPIMVGPAVATSLDANRELYLAGVKLMKQISEDFELNTFDDAKVSLEHLIGDSNFLLN